MGYGGMQGVPMIASSPVRHDSPLNLHGLEVTSYQVRLNKSFWNKNLILSSNSSMQPPWKALSDFALHADLDNNGAVNHTPAFQHLVNQASHHNFSCPAAATIWTSFIHFSRLFARGLALVSTHSFHSVLVSSAFNFFSFFIIYLRVASASSV